MAQLAPCTTTASAIARVHSNTQANAAVLALGKISTSTNTNINTTTITNTTTNTDTDANAHASTHDHAATQSDTNAHTHTDTNTGIATVTAVLTKKQTAALLWPCVLRAHMRHAHMPATRSKAALMAWGAQGAEIATFLQKGLITGLTTDTTVPTIVKQPSPAVMH